MKRKVLVAYGATNGSTARIAEAVADVLRKNGASVDTAPAGSIDDLAPYDAVIVGGALYTGRWHKDARSFVRRHRRALSKLPVWLFSSGSLDPSASERDVPPVPGVRRIMALLDAQEHVTFGGCLEEGASGFVARMILRNGKGGDFRDFPAIERWATRVAAEIRRAEDVTSGKEPA